MALAPPPERRALQGSIQSPVRIAGLPLSQRQDPSSRCKFVGPSPAARPCIPYPFYCFFCLCEFLALVSCSLSASLPASADHSRDGSCCPRAKLQFPPLFGSRSLLAEPFSTSSLLTSIDTAEALRLTGRQTTAPVSFLSFIFGRDPSRSPVFALCCSRSRNCTSGGGAAEAAAAASSSIC